MKKKKKKIVETAKAPFGSMTPVIGNRAALDAEVERRRKERGEGATAVAASEPEPIRDILAGMLAKQGMSLIDMYAAEAQLERVSRELAMELEVGRRKMAWVAKCPARYREEFFIELLPEDVDRESVRLVLNHEFSDRGLYVIGKKGTGKTRAMFTLLHRYYVKEERSVEWLDGVMFATECSKVFAESALAEPWMRRLLKPDVLFIDDLAKRFTPATQQGFFWILDRRTAAKKPIMLTTNCSGESLATMIGDDLLSEPMLRRLKEFTDVIVF